ncbi:MAG: ATP-grasp domain-containing protein [Gemmatimonadetes bacterium]|nr:ATP-grasp domain-containing protein [Gemmatimonadota bacterium]
MTNVVFVAPFLLETTLQFIEATCDLPGVRVSLVTQDPESKVPAALRKKVAEVEVAENALEAPSIQESVLLLKKKTGSVDRLLGALEELQVPLGEVREALQITGMTGDTARKFRDKALMKDVLAQAGLPCARHRRVSSSDEIWEFVKEVGYPLVFKPTAGSGSRSTFRVADEEQLKEAIGWGEPTVQHEAMLEEFVTGEEHSFDSVFLGGRMVWHSTTDYYPGPLEVLENPWVQWCVVLPRERNRPDFAEFRPLAEKALQTLGMVNGLSHMEWFRMPDGRFAISEVGARPPGAQFVRLISYAHDTNMYAAWAKLMVFDRFDPPDRPFAAGAAYLRGQGDGKVVKIHGLEEAQKKVGKLAVEVKLPRKGQSPGGTYDGDGYVIVRHPETAVVKEALASIVRTIRVELG